MSPEAFTEVYATAGEDLSGKEGYAATHNTTDDDVELGSGATDQATTQTTKVAGVIKQGGEAGDQVIVQRFGMSNAVAGTGGWTDGDPLVAEYDTGKLIPLDLGTAGADGDLVWILAYAVGDATADTMGRCFINPHVISASIPA